MAINLIGIMEYAPAIYHRGNRAVQALYPIQEEVEQALDDLGLEKDIAKHWDTLLLTPLGVYADLQVRMRTLLQQQPGNPNWSIVRLPRSVLTEHKLLPKQQRGSLSLSAFGPHVTVTRNEICTQAVAAYKPIHLVVQPPKRHGKSWQAHVFSRKLGQVRRMLKLSPRPKPYFHLAIGHFHEDS